MSANMILKQSILKHDIDNCHTLSARTTWYILEWRANAKCV